MFLIVSCMIMTFRVTDLIACFIGWVIIFLVNKYLGQEKEEKNEVRK